MKNTIKKSFVVLSLLILSSFALNASELSQSEKISNEYFEMFSRQNVDFDPTGKVCEQAALYELEKDHFPKSHYRLEQGISYFRGVETVGELDVVVFDKFSNQVYAVGEVKCWKNLKGGLRKAKQQQARFRESLNNKIVIRDASGAALNLSHFKNIKNYFSVAQEGALNAGFTYELPLNFKEFMTLRGRLLDCRAEKKCPMK